MTHLDAELVLASLRCVSAKRADENGVSEDPAADMGAFLARSDKRTE